MSQQGALSFAAVWGLGFTTAAYSKSGLYSAYFMLLLGFGAAVLWGTIWGISLRELGTYTKKTSAILIMSLIGGAEFPVIFGGLLDTNPNNPQTSLLVLIPCYVFILYYAWKGFRINNGKKSK